MDTEKLHDRVVNKWKWGNFDKQRLYAGQQRCQRAGSEMIIWRAAEQMVAEGKPGSIDITDAFFKGFPHELYL
ncbi:MAG: hypothetical protein IPP25_21815 [Saprospiraceae bacterium]|nr:hypothetical protein [Candidatus Opimibacter skivensis]